MQHLPVQPLADQHAHQSARLVARLGARVVVGGDVEQRPPADDERSGPRAGRRHRPPVRLVDVLRVGIYGAAHRVMNQKGSIAELGEQAFLEAAQYR